MAVGSVFLIGIALLVVANIVYRFFGGVIAGTYELVALMIVVTVAFALGYAALKQGHIVVRIVLSRFSPRIQAILTVFTSVIGLGFWALIAWKSAEIMSERALAGEYTEMLGVPYLPFRCAWLFGLLFFCLVLLIDLFKALSQAVRK
jgi:TRAP-type C4-dicarboxylate transport system permease small subunit